MSGEELEYSRQCCFHEAVTYSIKSVLRQLQPTPQPSFFAPLPVNTLMLSADAMPSKPGERLVIWRTPSADRGLSGKKVFSSAWQSRELS